jgi:hypothetical protein
MLFDSEKFILISVMHIDSRPHVRINKRALIALLISFDIVILAVMTAKNSLSEKEKGASEKLTKDLKIN